MKEINAYECQYCGRLLHTKTGCQTHESFCRRNERNARACYTCKFYDAARDRVLDEDNKIIVEAEFDGPHSILERKQLHRNYCKAENVLLFNPRGMNLLWRDWLENSEEWKAMPTAFEGCPNYAAQDYSYCKNHKPGYPLSHK